jgi:hypothetical protein
MGRWHRIRLPLTHCTEPAPAVFAAGDLCTEQPSVAGAIAAESQTAMVIVQDPLGR